MNWGQWMAAIDRVATILVVVVTVMTVIYLVMYSLSGWQIYRAGRAAMMQGIALLSLLVMALLTIFVGDFPGKPVVRLVIYSIMCWSSFRLLWTLRGYQRSSLGLEKDPDGVPEQH